MLCCLWSSLLLRCFKAVQRFEPLTVINEVDKHRSSWTRYYFLPIKQNSGSLLPNINDWTEAVWRIWPDCADTKSKIFTFLLFRSKNEKPLDVPFLLFEVATRLFYSRHKSCRKIFLDFCLEGLSKVLMFFAALLESGSSVVRNL